MKDIITKARRSLHILRKYVYYNYQFKPKKAYQSSRQYLIEHQHTNVQYLEIYPNYTTNLSVPEHFLKSIPPYCLYDKLLSEDSSTLTVTTTYRVIALPNGRLYSNNLDMVAVITEDNTLLGDVSLQYLQERVAKVEENKIFEHNYFLPPKKYNGVVFNMLAGGGPINNYGHWLIDVLPRIYLLQKSGWFHKVDWFVVPSCKHDFQKDSLKLLGISEDKIIQGDDQLHIIADLLIASTAPRGERSFLMPQWLVDFHRESYLPKSSVSSPAHPFIYISRRDGNTRKVVNEQKLIELLEKYNFSVVELSKLSFAEKISLFASAQVIISVVGAALSNVIYCQKGTKLLEIFPDVLVDTFNYNLATLVDVEYHYLICKTGLSTKQLVKATDTHVTVDLDKVQAFVESLCVLKNDS